MRTSMLTKYSVSYGVQCFQFNSMSSVVQHNKFVLVIILFKRETYFFVCVSQLMLNARYGGDLPLNDFNKSCNEN